jgi:hypothetical protein
VIRIDRKINSHVRRETKKLSARELLLHHNLSRLAQPNKVKIGLAQIDADGVQLHGTPPHLPL